MRPRFPRSFLRPLALTATLLSLAPLPSAAADSAPAPLRLTLDAAKPAQKIDGFGVNLTPAQWRGGALKPTIDRLVDDLGMTWVRFDCVGLADWLDPRQRDAQGHYPPAYLRSVYTNATFRDAWETARYLLTKPGVSLYLNVSGRVPAAMADPTGKILVDYAAYAQMVATLVSWARDEEKLPITLLDPFNETNLGLPEGPSLAADQIVPAFTAVVQALDAAGLSDVRLIGPCDSHLIMERVTPILERPELLGRFRALAFHNYGDDYAETGQNEIAEKIAHSSHPAVALWMNEYGDIDQSGHIEYAVGWRSTKRALRMVHDGFAGAMVWDAFDNFHEHDAAWATYGLLETDREHWTYRAKPRYYAAKHLYAFARPGFLHVPVSGTPRDPADVYAEWHDASRHLSVEGFVSPDRRQFSVVGVSPLEGPTAAELRIAGLAGPLGKVSVILTEAGRPFVVTETSPDADGVIRFTVPHIGIFTVTNQPVPQSAPVER